MKNVTTILICFWLLQLVPVTCISQNYHNVDSLINNLKSAKEDTNQANLLDSISKFWGSNETDKSLGYAKQELSLSLKLNYKRGIINADMSISDFYYQKNNYTSALDYLNKAITFINETNNKPALAYYYIHLSSIAMRQYDYLNAMDYSNKALQIAEEINDSALISKVLSNRGYIYINIYDYPTALTYFLRALKINQTRDDKVALSKSYFDIGLTYWFRHWTEEYNLNIVDSGNSKAIDYFQQSYDIAKKINNKTLMAMAQEKTGEVYNDEKKFKKALDCFQASLSQLQGIKDSFKMSVINRDISLIYSQQGQFNKAIQFLSTAFQIAERAGIKLEICYCYANIAAIYMAQKDYHTPINYLLKGLLIAKAIGQKNLQSNICDDLTKCYESLNDFKSAYKYSSQNNIIKDSILDVGETIKKTIEIGTLYTTESNKKEIALLTKDKKIQDLEIKKHALLEYMLIASLIMVCILFLFMYRNYRIGQSLKLQEIRNKIASDLHDDIGSTLSSISIFTLMARGGSKEVIPMLDQIGEYSRNLLESMADIVWNINPNNDNFEKIILRMRSFAFELMGAKDIDFEFNAEESLSNLKVSMELRKNLYLIFKEATNNLVKYSEASSALFSITRYKNTLTMLIRDNGKGFDVEQETKGNGLRNMKNRAIEIGAKFLIESEPGKGTTIQLLINTV
jgi:two-component system, NarL family, sensor histidine kinase UhpB